MKYWQDIKLKLKYHTEFAIQLLLVLLGIYTVLMASGNRSWKVFVFFIGLLSWFLLGTKKKHLIIWISLITLLLIDLYHDYYWVANHHFMLVFMVLSVTIYHYHKRTDVLQKNIQILFVVVVLTSVLQKLMSNQFMSGDFYYYMINRGTLFKYFVGFFPENLEIAKSNAQNLRDLYTTNPNDGQSVVLTNIIPNLGLMSMVFAWITIAMELLVAIAILLKPKKNWTHVLLILMIIGILGTRFETGFMALLAITGLFLCQNIYLRLVYILITLGCIVLVITKLGFH